MCENWGYKKLLAEIRKQAMDEMQLAQIEHTENAASRFKVV